MRSRSRSYIITALAEEKERVTREMDALFDELDLAGESIDLSYVTVAFRARQA